MARHGSDLVWDVAAIVREAMRGAAWRPSPSITVRVPLAIRRRPGRKTVVTPVRDGDETTLPTRADPALVKALARAFRYKKLLDEGRYASITEMAAADRIERGYLGTLLRLTLLAPDLVEAILEGSSRMGWRSRGCSSPCRWHGNGSTACRGSPLRLHAVCSSSAFRAARPPHIPGLLSRSTTACSCQP